MNWKQPLGATRRIKVNAHQVLELAHFRLAPPLHAAIMKAELWASPASRKHGSKKLWVMTSLRRLVGGEVGGGAVSTVPRHVVFLKL